MRQVIVLIRHGEKPEPGSPGKGVDKDGDEDSESLLVRGWQRAGGLALLFDGGSPRFERPARIYASGVIKKDGSGSRSKRPLQTIKPLARRIGVTPIDDFTKGEEAKLAAQLVGLDGVTLVSWPHQSTDEIVRAVFKKSFDRKWPDERYDLVWMLTRPDGASDWSFSETRQQLLVGDEGLPA